MAHANKVYKTKNGKPTRQFTWRVLYKAPKGHKPEWLSESGFPTEGLAKKWGREQERQIEDGTWIPPEKRDTTFGEFAEVFMAAKSKRGRTVGTRWDNLELHILPRWKTTRLRDINWFDVDAWQQTLEVADIRRRQCVSLMSTVMTGAVDARYIHVNPLYGRRCTRDTAGDAAQPKQPKIRKDGGVRPEDAILIAERLGPAVGTHVLATAFSGLRWGEGLGLHRSNALLWRRQPWGAGEFACQILRVKEEYAEYQERDKGGRKKGYVIKLEPTKNDGSTRDIDVPPFLARLIRWHMEDWPHDRLFCTPSGTVWRRGNWSRDFRPACDGRPEREKRQGVSYRAGWEPICEGLDMRALRALHDTLQSEIGVKKPLEFEAAGHRRPDIKRHYQKPTAAMRAQRLEGLEEIFWGAMANVGLRALWGRVDLVRHP